MSRLKKTRKNVIMSDSLIDKLDSVVPEAKEEVYKPVENKGVDFLDVVDESIEVEESKGKNKNKISWSAVVGILLIGVFLALCIGGYLFISSVL